MTGQSEEMVLVPRNPTPEMVEAAWVWALAEDADGVWRAMVKAYLGETGRATTGIPLREGA